MSLDVVAPTPCWEIATHTTDGREWWPHFTSWGDAVALFTEERLDDGLGDPDPAAVVAGVVKSEHPCVRLVCDWCGLAEGNDGELVDVADGLHFEPINLSIRLDFDDWTEYDDGRHRCSECVDVEPDPQDLARRPGPDDVPLPLEGLKL